MDIETLKQLGMNIDDLQEKIIDQAVQAILYGVKLDDEDGHEYTIVHGIKKEIEKRVMVAVNSKIDIIANEHIVPKVGEMIESVTLQKSNEWGEPKGTAMSFREYIAHMAESYMTEDVDSAGRAKRERERSYDWRKEGPRLLVLMRNYIHETLNKAAKGAVSDVNKVIAQNIAKAATDAIEAAAKNLKVEVK